MKLTSISNLKLTIRNSLSVTRYSLKDFKNSRFTVICLLLSMLCVLSFSGCGGGGGSNTTTTTNTSNNGSLYVETTPPSTTVYLNGENKGTTPLSLTIPAGSYTLKVSKNLYQDKLQTIVVEVNKTTLVSVTLDQDTSSLTLPPF